MGKMKEMLIDNTLEERGSKYGDFNGHSKITQSIKRAMQDSPNWEGLDDSKKEALEMVAHKIGRILNGDPEYHDSWFDIIGYIRLVEQELEQPVPYNAGELGKAGCISLRID